MHGAFLTRSTDIHGIETQEKYLLYKREQVYSYQQEAWLNKMPVDKTLPALDSWSLILPFQHLYTCAAPLISVMIYSNAHIQISSESGSCILRLKGTIISPTRGCRFLEGLQWDSRKLQRGNINGGKKPGTILGCLGRLQCGCNDDTKSYFFIIR